ncbi:3-methyladenine DNA glycosylase 2 [Pusillimonas sp. TS35]|uniref:DNA-3-methyladenine glycosylase family protein n=1 Tax=Paracandidimonas lactea TaxID=2895524 RepID=UPI00136B8016|nr:DNA-3-methyladenine glycosylase 2 family protein [Paracandidimonas lactea]MYN11759.1 3-methyladenine DNA glycosylase 2 [Pusillimonas sp. TS35]
MPHLNAAGRSSPPAGQGITCVVPLPPGFRAGDALDFHRRDAQEIAERVSGAVLEKGLLWDDRPACLRIRFQREQVHAALLLDAPAPRSVHSEKRLESMLRRMLGLSQDIEVFEQRFRTHPVVGQMVSQQAGLRVPAAATPFEALAWAIMGQQISVGAAVSIRRRLMQAANIKHSSGLLCHPGPKNIVQLGADTLRQTGFSTSKANALLHLASLIADEQLPFERWLQQAPAMDDIRERLLAIRGIGPWTVNYTLLRGFGWLDGSLHGDVAVRRAIEALLARPDKLNEKQAQAWLMEFSPWRALMAAHLWASRSNTAY